MRYLITHIAVLSFLMVNAQTTSIPDANFEQALIYLGYDTGTPDGSVPTSNISSVFYLDVTSYNISDLTGIADFNSLTDLNCSSNSLTSLDLSSNINLYYLDCSNNQLTSLDITNTSLNSLHCSNNQLTSLDLTNLDLDALDCSFNQLTNLDISVLKVVANLNYLQPFICSNNQISSLNLGYGNKDFPSIDCSNNLLAELDLSFSPSCSIINFSNNQLTCLNLAVDSAYLNYISSNYYQSIDALNNPSLLCVDVNDSLYSNTNWPTWWAN